MSIFSQNFALTLESVRPWDGFLDPAHPCSPLLGKPRMKGSEFPSPSPFLRFDGRRPLWGWGSHNQNLPLGQRTGFTLLAIGNSELSTRVFPICICVNSHLGPQCANPARTECKRKQCEHCHADWCACLSPLTQNSYSSAFMKKEHAKLWANLQSRLKSNLQTQQ